MNDIRKKIILVLIFLVLGVFPISAANEVVSQFLNLSGSARTDALGGAYTAVGESADTVGVNPAGLYGLQELDTFFSVYDLMDSTSYFKGFMGDSFGKYGVFGAHISSLSSGAIEGTRVNKFGDVESTGNYFGVSGQSYNISYANKFFWDMAMGITAKVVREDYIISSETSYAFDIGVQRYFFSRKLMGGVSLLNLGPPIKRSSGGSVDDYLPMTARFGLGYMTLDIHNHSILVLADASYGIDEVFRMNLGAEYTMYHLFKFRVGYFPNSVDESFSFGMGLQKLLNQTSYSIDYAMQNNKNFGLSSRITVKASWQPITAKKIKHPIVKIKLKDGSVLVGKILSRTDKKINLDIYGQGKISVKKRQIENISKIPIEE